MKLKTVKAKIGNDEVEVAVVKNGMPVYVGDNNIEIEFDAPEAMAKIGALNSEAKTHRLAAKAANEKLDLFKDIADPAAAVKALQFASSMEGKKIMDDEAIKKLIESSTKPYQDKLTEKDTLLAEKEKHIYTLEVSNRFASSTFLKNSTIYGETPEVAEAYFGKNFKVEGGKVIAYDPAGNPIYSTLKPGEPAGFEEAISVLVNSHPKKDHILKAKGASGSGAGQGSGGGSGAKRSTMSQVDKSNYIKENGLEAFQKLPA